ncbi:F-box/LRR-repeat protein [Pyrus ussuriensis x Pyrus communis]|uniref:F-box/LRR-repeat protein n=1 Tax=Pyrus ussuriensis x Pyrus communis TaxID=2448454 RepID=A0A5N5HVI0_9ROSA|nr:F-box/LRR-repeat protein [Pyrus ussuriensis x Pyrus communis]
MSKVPHRHITVKKNSLQPILQFITVVDRFSNLPDEVAHQILSLVSLKELIRVGSLSKRCRVLYLSTPSLKFWSSYYGDKQGQLNLLNSFDRFLILRGGNKVQKFQVHLDLCSSLPDEIFRVITWIHIAARCNVEVLDLQLRVYKNDMASFELPSCIFLCGSLRYLIVTLYTVLKVPSFAGSTNLRHLNLSYVQIDDGFSKWISNSCKCIKELQLYHVGAVNITIESSSLESFRFVSVQNDTCHLNITGEKLEDIHVNWEYYQRGSRSLTISAPNLKYFKWIGSLLNRQNLRELMCLEKAEIFLKPRRGICENFDNASEFLRSICRVKVLLLSHETIKVKYALPCRLIFSFGHNKKFDCACCICFGIYKRIFHGTYLGYGVMTCQ